MTSLCRPLRVTPTQKAVLMCVADYAHDNGLDWHSIPAICEWTCLSRTAVIDALKGLESSEFVSIAKDLGKNNRCTINLEKVSSTTSQYAGRTGTGTGRVRQTYTTSAADAPPPVRQADYTRTPDAPEASISIIQASKKQKTPRASKSRKSSLPVGFSISEEVRDWAAAKGFSNLDTHLDWFTGYAVANGKTYSDWHQAFRNAIAGNWAKVKNHQQPVPSPSTEPSGKDPELLRIEKDRADATPMPPEIREQFARLRRTG